MVRCTTAHRLVLVVCAAVTALVGVGRASASPEGDVATSLVSETSYRHYLEDLLYANDGDDRGFGPEHDLARDNIAAIMTSFGLAVTLEPFEFNSTTYYNVVGTKYGLADSSVEYVIGAHMDTVGNPGADDNGSGVALLLEAGRVLSRYNSDFTIRFIAFDREEQGMLGSTAYVQNHITDDIRGMISADMVGHDIGTNTVDLHSVAASLENENALVEAIGLYGEGLHYHLEGWSGFSDHWPFEQAGFPATLLIEDWGNPNYHQITDSLDTPDYIDFAFALRITRSIVGFLVDQAGVRVPVPDADFDDSGVVDQADLDAFVECFGGAGRLTLAECMFFDFDSDFDVDCNDFTLFEAVWETGDPMPTFGPCLLPGPIVESLGSRCITVIPPERGTPLALIFEGDMSDPKYYCLSQYVQEDGSLGSTEFFQTYDAWGIAKVCDETIVGQTRYFIRCDYGEPGDPTFSTAESVETLRWGDVTGSDITGGWSKPDGNIDFNDITAVVDSFREAPGALSIEMVDLVGANGHACGLDGTINFDDISGVVDGFRGLSYWAALGCSPLCP